MGVWFRSIVAGRCWIDAVPGVDLCFALMNLDVDRFCSCFVAYLVSLLTQPLRSHIGLNMDVNIVGGTIPIFDFHR